MKVHMSHSLEETGEIAQNWLISIADADNVSKSAEIDLNAEQSTEATVVGLSGHLGAGKTAFVKLAAKLLGVKEEVTSPTFVIMKMYEINSTRLAETVSSTLKNEEENGGAKRAERLPIPGSKIPWRRLVHIDAYRLERPEELEALNFDKLVADPCNLILVEWPENVELKKMLPESDELKFELVDGAYRIIVL